MTYKWFITDNNLPHLSRSGEAPTKQDAQSAVEMARAVLGLKRFTAWVEGPRGASTKLLPSFSNHGRARGYAWVRERKKT